LVVFSPDQYLFVNIWNSSPRGDSRIQFSICYNNQVRMGLIMHCFYTLFCTIRFWILILKFFWIVTFWLINLGKNQILEKLGFFIRNIIFIKKSQKVDYWMNLQSLLLIFNIISITKENKLTANFYPWKMKHICHFISKEAFYSVWVFICSYIYAITIKFLKNVQNLLEISFIMN
jgi:hypothetical protein